MRDPCPPCPAPALYRCSVHLKDRASTALTDEIELLRNCTALELQEGGLTIHAACLLPHCLYLVLSIEENEDPEARLRRICASFKRHSTAELSWHWPCIAPLRVEEMAPAMREVLAMPVTWGLTERPEDWPHSSLHRHTPQHRAVAA